MLQEKADSVPPRQFLTFLLEPDKSNTGDTFYRELTPRYRKGELDTITYKGAKCEMLSIEHAVTRGWCASISGLITIISLVVGVVVSIKKDIGSGFAAASWGAIPLAVVIGLWTKS